MRVWPRPRTAGRKTGQSFSSLREPNTCCKDSGTECLEDLRSRRRHNQGAARLGRPGGARRMRGESHGRQPVTKVGRRGGLHCTKRVEVPQGRCATLGCMCVQGSRVALSTSFGGAPQALAALILTASEVGVLVGHAEPPGDCPWELCANMTMEAASKPPLTRANLEQGSPFLAGGLNDLLPAAAKLGFGRDDWLTKRSVTGYLAVVPSTCTIGAQSAE